MSVILGISTIKYILSETYQIDKMKISNRIAEDFHSRITTTAHSRCVRINVFQETQRVLDG